MVPFLISACFSFKYLSSNHTDASIDESKPVRNFLEIHGLLVRLRVSFLSFLKGTLLSKFEKIVEA